MSLIGARGRKEVEVVCTDAAREKVDDGVVRFAPRFGGHLVDALSERASARGALMRHAPNEECMLASVPIPCSRIRFSNPTAQLLDDDRPILPVSVLASCNKTKSSSYRKWIEGRVVVLQLSSFFADLHTTPMTVGWLSDRRFAPGSQIIADAIETILHDDEPRLPPMWAVVLLLLLSSFLGVWAGAYLRPQLALCVPLIAPFVF